MKNIKRHSIEEYSIDTAEYILQVFNKYPLLVLVVVELLILLPIFLK